MQTTGKTAIQRLLAGVAVLALGAGTGAMAANSDPSGTVATPTAGANSSGQPAPIWHYRAHIFQPEMLEQGLTGALHRLNLNTRQQRQVQGILARAGEGFAQERAVERSNFPALSNPGSPNYTRAVRIERNTALARVNLAIQTEQDLYRVLTPAQKARFPSVMAGAGNAWQSASAQPEQSPQRSPR